MKDVKMFYLKNCPHCKNAFRMIEQLKNENEKYKDIQITCIEESIEVDLANSYDYFYVPTYYVNEVKMHEGVPTLSALEAVLEAAVE